MPLPEAVGVTSIGPISTAIDPRRSSRSNYRIVGARDPLRFWREQGGATAIEYGLIVAGISIIIIAAVNGLGPNLSGKFDSIRNDKSTLSGLSGPGVASCPAKAGRRNPRRSAASRPRNPRATRVSALIRLLHTEQGRPAHHNRMREGLLKAYQDGSLTSCVIAAGARSHSAVLCFRRIRCTSGGDGRLL